MNDRPIVFFDLETSGLEPDAEIIQIAAIAVGYPSFVEIESFQYKIHFDVERAHPKALEVNHFSPEVWAAEAASRSYVLSRFALWLKRFASIQLISKKGSPYYVAQLVGFNSENFDNSRLQQAYRDEGIFLPAHYRTLDALQLAAWDALESGLVAPSLRLTDIAERFGISTEGAHDALADVRMTIEVAKRIMGDSE